MLTQVNCFFCPSHTLRIQNIAHSPPPPPLHTTLYTLNGAKFTEIKFSFVAFSRYWHAIICLCWLFLVKYTYASSICLFGSENCYCGVLDCCRCLMLFLLLLLLSYVCIFFASHSVTFIRSFKCAKPSSKFEIKLQNVCHL